MKKKKRKSRKKAKTEIDLYKEAKIKRIQILIANDERTCEICLALSGLIVPVDEAENLLPFHSGCRCVWIVVIGKPLLKEPSIKALQDFVLKYPNLPVSKISVMPKIPKFEKKRSKAEIEKRAIENTHIKIFKKGEKTK